MPPVTNIRKIVVPFDRPVSPHRYASIRDALTIADQNTRFNPTITISTTAVPTSPRSPGTTRPPYEASTLTVAADQMTIETDEDVRNR